MNDNSREFKPLSENIPKGVLISKKDLIHYIIIFGIIIFCIISYLDNNDKLDFLKEKIEKSEKIVDSLYKENIIINEANKNLYNDILEIDKRLSIIDGDLDNIRKKTDKDVEDILNKNYNELYEFYIERYKQDE